MPESSIRNKNLKITNSSGIPIDPSTETKQDTQISNQLDLISLTETLQELLSRIAGLASARGTSSDIRVTVLSGTLTNISQIGGITSTIVVPSIQNTSAVMANINNVAVT